MIITMKAYERLIRYAAYPTASDEAQDGCPSTPAQTELAKALADELRAIGCTEVTLDENGYVFASIPASAGCEDAPVLGFIAHMDVSPEVEDKNIRPRTLVYEGGDILLNEEKGIVMRQADYPVLGKYIGKTLIVTDGTTLLGADDKAGIAEIITAAERMIADPSIRHGKIRIGFTPDEEIGRGADLFDVAAFGAAYAYTVDGGSFGEVEYETFNAAALKVTLTGRSIHPGSAKNKMVNASLLAMEYMSLLPALERPERTEGYEGFYHLTDMDGGVEEAHLKLILRDHDAAKLEERKAIARRAADELNRRYGYGAASVDIRDSYRNMREAIEKEWHLIENASAAVKEIGAEPISVPVRGGTDGSRLSFMGLPCPNLGTGSHNHHGRFEFACAEAMEDCTALLIRLAGIYGGMTK